MDWRDILGALYLDAKFVFEYDTSRQITADIALFSKVLKAEAEINRAAAGLQNVIDKGQEVIDKGKEIIEQSKNSLGCESALGAGAALTACLLIAWVFALMRYKK